MNRYYVFYCDRYYPRGGMDALLDTFDDENDAIAYLNHWNERNEWFREVNHGHVYDIIAEEIIYRLYKENEV